MKRVMIGLVVTVALLAAYTFAMIYDPNTETRLYRITMTMVNSEKITATHRLPTDAKFYISTSRGSYKATYSTHCAFFDTVKCSHTLKNAIIRVDKVERL